MYTVFRIRWSRMYRYRFFLLFIYILTFTHVFISVKNIENINKSIRDPFSDKTPTEKRMTLRQSKRTQRYRSTAKSRILGMTVGDIRYCFQQLRAAGDSLTPYFILYNGLYAGEFTLMYLIETSNSMKKRRRKKKYEEEGSGVISNVEDCDPLPESQLCPKRLRSEECVRSMEF